MRNLTLALALLLVPSLGRLASADEAPKPAPVEPPAGAAPAPAPVAPKLLEGAPAKPKTVAKESHRDTDHVGGRECEPDAMGLTVCKAPGAEPAHPTLAN